MSTCLTDYLLYLWKGLILWTVSVSRVKTSPLRLSEVDVSLAPTVPNDPVLCHDHCTPCLFVLLCFILISFLCPCRVEECKASSKWRQDGREKFDLRYNKINAWERNSLKCYSGSKTVLSSVAPLLLTQLQTLTVRYNHRPEHWMQAMEWGLIAT